MTTAWFYIVWPEAIRAREPEQGCQIFRISSTVPLFSAFWKMFDTFSINRFQETIRNEKIFVSKSMTLTMQSLQNHGKEINVEIFLRRSKKKLDLSAMNIVGWYHFPHFFPFFTLFFSAFFRFFWRVFRFLCLNIWQPWSPKRMKQRNRIFFFCN